MELGMTDRQMGSIWCLAAIRKRRSGKAAADGVIPFRDVLFG